MGFVPHAAQRTRCIAAVVVASTAAIIALSFAGSPPASAAGDATLDRLIVNDANPGWEPLPSNFSEELASLEQRSVSSVSGESVSVAAQGWHDGAARLVVILVRFSDDVPVADRNARAAVISLCASATGNSPTAVEPFAGIEHSAEGNCTGKTASGDALSAFSISWAKRNVFVIVSGSGLSQSEVEAVATGQDAALPAGGVMQDSHSSNAALGFAVIGGVVVAAAVGIGLFISRSRKRKRESATDGALAYPTQPLPQGWHPVAGDARHLAYWDGTRWTAQLHWDGSSWVDASGVAGPRL
jgi:hypothetical protein